MTSASGRRSTASTELVAAAPLEIVWATATTHTPVGLYPKSGILPGVVDVHDQTGAWDAPGQTRTLVLSDGGSVIEHTTDVVLEGFFAYNLTDFQGLFGKIVRGARAEWTFTPTSEGTRVHWRYTFTARPGSGYLVRAIVRLLWAGYMRKVLPGIAAEAERAAGQVD